MNKNEESKTFTTLAFLLGLLLLDSLTSTEQNALGNWLMLIAQTLCTNGSYNFNNEWKGQINSGNINPENIFNKFKDSVNKVGDMYNEIKK